ncbi:MAG: HAD-IIA family hydrolase [Candidatus Bathyarchaeia archaeon]
MKLTSAKAFFFDMDGVLSVGKEKPRYLGGREIVARIKDTGRQAYVLTNDSTHTRQELHQNLSNLGFSFVLEDILTSSYLTASYLKEKVKANVSFFLIGERGLQRELEDAGHNSTDTQPDVVIVGLDRKLTYEKLNSALQFLKNGALLIGSYGGTVYMSDHGPAMSAGPIIKALEYASDRRAIMIGKPSTHMFRLALNRANVKASQAVMIGDQIETDLIGAHKVGLRTVLVLTGVETEETLKRSKIKPELILNNVDILAKYI